MKLVVEPPATVRLCLCSDAILDVSHDFIFTALELSALKKWFVRPANESDYTVTDYGSHVKRVLTSFLLFPFFFGHGGMLRVNGSLADVPSASRTCPC